MSFNHMAMSKLETQTANIMQWVRTVTHNQFPWRAQHERMVDDIPMRNGLADLCDAVRRQYKDVRFLCDSASLGSYSGSSFVESIWACFTGDAYGLVRIAYHRNPRGVTENVYYIRARHIANERFSIHNMDYYELTTKDLAKATKRVKTYLRPYTVGEVAALSYSDFRSKVTKARAEVSNAVQQARVEITQHNGFVHELANLLTSEYKFLNPELKGHIQAYFAAVEEHKARGNGRLLAAYVNVRMQGDTQMFDVVRTTRCVTDMWSFYPSDTEQMVTYSSDTLPESMAGKLATLSMLDVGTHLDDAGMRNSEATFWVYL